MLASPGGGLTHAVNYMAPKIQINPLSATGSLHYMDESPEKAGDQEIFNVCPSDNGPPVRSVDESLEKAGDQAVGPPVKFFFGMCS
jgi:hypothetical protein